MVNFFRHLAGASVLAFLACLFSCTEMPPGQDIHFGFTFNPLGLTFGVTQSPTLAPGLPDSFLVVPGPTTAPAPATAPTPSYLTISPLSP